MSGKILASALEDARITSFDDIGKSDCIEEAWT